jgi:hypothetical protein
MVAGRRDEIVFQPIELGPEIGQAGQRGHTVFRGDTAELVEAHRVIIASTVC